MGGCAWGSHAVRGLQCGRWVYIGVYKRSVKCVQLDWCVQGVCIWVSDKESAVICYKSKLSYTPCTCLPSRALIRIINYESLNGSVAKNTLLHNPRGQ